MARLSRVIVEAMILEYGRDELLRRLAHPFWFQSFGAVMGMDWHSSGITTAVVGALKHGLEPVQDELGLWVCGGRGRHSRETPAQLLVMADHTGLDGAQLVRTSRLVAKVDSAAVQDGFSLYLHGFFVGADGKWAVVQQGMDTAARQARRYHWLSEGLTDFIDEPHAAIEGPNRGAIVNLTDRRARDSRQAQLALVHGGPDIVLEALRKREPPPSQAVLLPHLKMPAHHEVVQSDVQMRRLHAALRAAAERGPVDFPELLLTPGVGARTIETLALVAEVIHGAPYRFSDPARFAYALGGKDRHPFPVPLKVYDRTLSVLRGAVEKAQLGNDDRLAAIRTLDQQARLLDGVADGPSWNELVAREHARSPELGGMSVFGPAAKTIAPAPKHKGQLSLFAPTGPR